MLWHPFLVSIFDHAKLTLNYAGMRPMVLVTVLISSAGHYEASEDVYRETLFYMKMHVGTFNQCV